MNLLQKCSEYYCSTDQFVRVEFRETRIAVNLTDFANDTKNFIRPSRHSGMLLAGIQPNSNKGSENAGSCDFYGSLDISL
jgi:hypothetical protein